MITIELLRLIQDGQPCEPQLAARIVADANGIVVDGPEPELVDRDQPVLNMRNGNTITSEVDPEEWARGLTVAFRTPYLSVRIVEDTNPVPDVEIEPANVREPVFR